MNFFVNLLAPVVTLVVLNILIYRNMPRLGAPPAPAPVPTAQVSYHPPAANAAPAVPQGATCYLSADGGGNAKTTATAKDSNSANGGMRRASNASSAADAVVTIWYRLNLCVTHKNMTIAILKLSEHRNSSLHSPTTTTTAVSGGGMNSMAQLAQLRANEEAARRQQEQDRDTR